MAAVPTRGTAAGNELLATEGHAAVAAVAGTSCQWSVVSCQFGRGHMINLGKKMPSFQFTGEEHRIAWNVVAG
jgi:hypothetical protein